jgi:acetoin utilization deacetylase AcuC-like enzyme
MSLDALRAGGFAPDQAVHQPEPASREQLLRVHTEAYLSDFENLVPSARILSSELPISEEIVQGFKLMAGGTILAARLALDEGCAFHIGGGFHHAFADRAEGFCYINDIAVAIRAMMSEGRIRRAAVIDVDLHQGNGTARIFQDDPAVFTFSIHQELLYPFKETSDVDIGLDLGVGDEAYLDALAGIVPDRVAEHRPDLVIYVAGADPYQEDQLGDLKLTLEGLARRDRLVAEACRRNDWPMAAVLGGGYALDVNDTARIHAQTAIEMARAWGAEPA